MAKKPSCHCKKASECEECPEWIFTFADLVMLMMGFFVILWVLKPGMQQPQDPKQQNAAQTDNWLETVGEIRGGFGWEPDPKSSDPVDQVMIRKRMHGPGDKGKSMRTSKGAEGSDPEVTSIRPGKQASVGSRLLFEKADARLTPETSRLLDQIVLQIRGHRNIVLIKGHASRDDNVDSAAPEQNMDLSLRRAQAVADYLTTHGVEPEILRVQGCSTFEPVVQRTYTSNAQTENRRVEVEATATLVEDLQDPPTSTGGHR